VLPNLAQISRVTPLASAAIHAPDSSGPIAAVDAIATIAAETIAEAAADPTVVAVVPAVPPDSNAVQAEAHVTTGTPGLHAVLNSFPKC
jgi:hypothetical protein